jgi:hypothetical protein
VSRRFRASARAALRPLRVRRLAVVASADAESPALPAAVAVVAPVVRSPLVAPRVLPRMQRLRRAAPRMRAPRDATRPELTATRDARLPSPPPAL